jgi:putative peptidoglycan lipid II flippase
MLRRVTSTVAGWYCRSSHRHVISAAAIVASFAFASKLASAAKEVVVADRFGTSDAVDALGLALALPSFAISVLGGSLNAAFLPAYIDVKQREGLGGAQRLLATTALASILLLSAVALLIAAVVPVVLPLASHRFTPEKMQLTVYLSYLLVPSVAIGGVTMLWSGVLNAHGKFAAAAGAGLAVPVVSVGSLLALGRAWGIRALAFGIVAGYCCEALVVARAVGREGLSVLPRWNGFTAPVRRVATQYVPMIAGALVMGTNPLVDSLMASRLDAGSVASLGYGNKLVAFAMGIGAVSLSAAVFPHFSRLASSQDWDGLARTIRTYAGVVLALAVPLALFGMALSEPIARLLYERGAFTRTDTLQVGRIQALYLAQVPFHLTGLVFARFLSASGANRVLMWISIVSCAVNVTGNVVLSRYLGAPGIALSTSVVYATSFTLLGTSTWRRLAALRGGRVAQAGGEAALQSGRGSECAGSSVN